MRLFRTSLFIFVSILTLLISQNFTSADEGYIDGNTMVINGIIYENKESSFSKLSTTGAGPSESTEEEYSADSNQSLDGQTVAPTVICEGPSQLKCTSIGNIEAVAIGEPVLGTFYKSSSLWQEVEYDGKKYYVPYENLNGTDDEQYNYELEIPQDDDSIIETDLPGDGQSTWLNDYSIENWGNIIPNLFLEDKNITESSGGASVPSFGDAYSITTRNNNLESTLSWLGSNSRRPIADALFEKVQVGSSGLIENKPESANYISTATNWINNGSQKLDELRQGYDKYLKKREEEKRNGVEKLYKISDVLSDTSEKLRDMPYGYRLLGIVSPVFNPDVQALVLDVLADTSKNLATFNDDDATYAARAIAFGWLALDVADVLTVPGKGTVAKIVVREAGEKITKYIIRETGEEVLKEVAEKAIKEGILKKSILPSFANKAILTTKSLYRKSVAAPVKKAYQGAKDALVTTKKAVTDAGQSVKDNLAKLFDSKKTDLSPGVIKSAKSKMDPREQMSNILDRASKEAPGSHIRHFEIADGNIENVAGATGKADPQSLRFSQPQISNTFSDFRKTGYTVNKLILDLKTGIVNAEKIKPLKIINVDGKWYSLDNRRLFAFKEAGVKVRYEVINLDSKVTKQKMQNNARMFGDGESIVFKNNQLTLIEYRPDYSKIVDETGDSYSNLMAQFLDNGGDIDDFYGKTKGLNDAELDDLLKDEDAFSSFFFEKKSTGIFSKLFKDKTASFRGGKHSIELDTFKLSAENTKVTETGGWVRVNTFYNELSNKAIGTYVSQKSTRLEIIQIPSGYSFADDSYVAKTISDQYLHVGGNPEKLIRIQMNGVVDEKTIAVMKKAVEDGVDFELAFIGSNIGRLIDNVAENLGKKVDWQYSGIRKSDQAKEVFDVFDVEIKIVDDISKLAITKGGNPIEYKVAKIVERGDGTVVGNTRIITEPDLYDLPSGIKIHQTKFLNDGYIEAAVSADKRTLHILDIQTANDANFKISNALLDQYYYQGGKNDKLIEIAVDNLVESKTRDSLNSIIDFSKYVDNKVAYDKIIREAFKDTKFGRIIQNIAEGTGKRPIWNEMDISDVGIEDGKLIYADLNVLLRYEY